MPEDVLQPNTLTFFDMGYLDLERFVDMTHRGAFFVTRLKSNHNPVIRRVYEGAGKRVQARGMRIEDALAENVLEFRRDFGEAYLDLDVVLDDGNNQAIGRVVAIQNEDGQRWWYVLNVDRNLLPAKDVGTGYALRWDIKLLFKQLKSGAGLSAVIAWRSSAVLAFLYAKIVALSSARLLELSVEQKYGPRAPTQLALLLTLSVSYSKLETGICQASYPGYKLESCGKLLGGGAALWRVEPDAGDVMPGAIGSRPTFGMLSPGCLIQAVASL